MSRTAELMLLRIALGHLSALADRPFSEGNIVGYERNYHGARRTLDRLREHAGRLISRVDASYAALFGPSERSRIPPAIAAEALRAPITDFLHQIAMPRYAVRHSGAACPVELTSSIDRLLVLVGPSLGLGDEVMFARALTEATRGSRTRIEIWSTCPDVWSAVRGKGDVFRWEPDPSELIRRIESLPAEEPGAVCGLIAADFYGVDPPDGYFFLPRGYAYVASAALGSKVVSVSRDGPEPCHHVLNWHSSWPLSFEGICLRFVSFMGFEAGDPDASCPLRSFRRGRPIYINPFTSKPYLVPDPRLYGDALMGSDVLDEYGGIRVLSGPTDRTRAVAEEFAESLAGRLAHPGSLDVVNAPSIQEVYEELKGAGLILGPDTFTVHLGSELGVPNVAVSHATHRAWMPLGGACLRVRAFRDQRKLEADLTRALRWSNPRGAPAAIRSRRDDHRGLLDRASRELRRFYVSAHELAREEVGEERARFFEECASWLVEMQDLFPECEDRRYAEIARFSPRPDDHRVNASAWLWAWLGGNLPGIVRNAAVELETEPLERVLK